MENTDNKEIRQLLKKAIERLAIIDVPSECFVRQALALLPCETCGGTGMVNSGNIDIGDGIERIGEFIPCPDCQS